MKNPFKLAKNKVSSWFNGKSSKKKPKSSVSKQGDKSHVILYVRFINLERVILYNGRYKLFDKRYKD